MTKERKEQIVLASGKAVKKITHSPNNPDGYNENFDSGFILGYNVGAGFADKNPPWIDCKVQLPVENEHVLIWIEPIFCNASYSKRTFHNQGNSFELVFPTHWMRIAPPSTK